MTITIYKDPAANAIFIEDANGVQFLNSLQASKLEPTDTVINITDLARDILIFSQVEHTEFIDETGDPYGATATDTCNALNALFLTAGSPTGAPVITSDLSVNLTTGDSINYEMVATGGVGFEWENLPTGVVTVEGNVRKIVGGTTLTAGTYTPLMRAVNYFGQDEETLTITVSNPPYSNTKSVNFVNLDYVSADPTLASELSRIGNGSGASDAWTIMFWFKPGTSTNNSQTVWYYGDSSGLIDGVIDLKYQGGSSNKNLLLRYGSFFSNLTFETPQDSLTVGTWHQVILTYDGGTTGDSSGDLADYHSRFKIFIDGVSQTLTKDHSGFGWTGDIPQETFNIGRDGSSDYMRNSCRVDEAAIWSSDQTANVSTIYNSGTTQDLSILGSPPVNWWRMGDGDTFPTLVDNIGSADFTMNNMTVADIVTDAP